MKNKILMTLAFLQVSDLAQAAPEIIADITIKGVSGYSGTVYVNDASNIVLSTPPGKEGKAEGYPYLKPGDIVYGFYTQLDNSIQDCRSETPLQTNKIYTIEIAPEKIVEGNPTSCSVKVTLGRKSKK